MTFFAEATDTDDAVLSRRLSGEALTAKEEDQYKTAVLLHLGREYAKRDWAMQLHLVHCATTTRGCSNGSVPIPAGIPSPNGWWRTICRVISTRSIATACYRAPYPVPRSAQNEVLGTMIGNFQDGQVIGKMQFGSGWWFNDQKDGMIRQIDALACVSATSAHWSGC